MKPILLTNCTRARAVHFKKSGDLDRHGKVDVTQSEIMKLRTQELGNKTTAIRDRGTAALAKSPLRLARGEGQGEVSSWKLPDDSVTHLRAVRLAALTAAITGFSKVMSTPRGQSVNRSALLKEVETDVAALLEKVSDMDDLVVQFDGSEPGKRFIEAWKRSRIIVDSGGGHSTGGTPPTPPAPPHP